MGQQLSYRAVGMAVHIMTKGARWTGNGGATSRRARKLPRVSTPQIALAPSSAGNGTGPSGRLSR